MNDDGFNIAALLSFSLSESIPQSSSYILSLLVPALNRKLFDVYTVKSSNQRLRIFFNGCTNMTTNRNILHGLSRCASC